MQESDEGTVQNRKRPMVNLVAPVLIGLLGLQGFYRVTQRPEFESYRTVDVVQLLASGASFGVLLAFIVLFLRRRPI